MFCSDAHAPVLGASVKPKAAAQMEQLKGTVHVCISSTYVMKPQLVCALPDLICLFVCFCLKLRKFCRLQRKNPLVSHSLTF